jgi:cephalosporin hydroxylase
MSDGHLDWAYVDSSHAYDHTLKELRLLARKVNASGVIAGDDWREDPSHRHHGICRAVREFITAEPYVLEVDKPTLQWMITRKPMDSP